MTLVDGGFDVRAAPAAVPAPPSWLLLGIGGLCFGAYRWARRGRGAAWR